MVRAWCALCRPQQPGTASAPGSRRAEKGSAARRTPLAKPAANRRSATGSGSTPPSSSDMHVQRRERGLVEAERTVAKARRRSPAELAAALARLATAQARLEQARRAAGKRSGAPSFGAVTVRHSPGHRQGTSVQELTDRGTAASRSPLLDPDIAAGLVWVLPRGSVFHRRDCHIVDGRSDAVPRRATQVRSRLRRCEHCSPLA